MVIAMQAALKLWSEFITVCQKLPVPDSKSGVFPQQYERNIIMRKRRISLCDSTKERVEEKSEKWYID